MQVIAGPKSKPGRRDATAALEIRLAQSCDAADPNRFGCVGSDDSRVGDSWLV